LVGIEVDRGQIALRQLRPRVRRADDVLELPDPRIGDLLARAADVDADEVRAAVEVLAETLPTLGVGEHDLRARVGEAVLELGPGPPRVEPRHDGADEPR